MHFQQLSLGWTLCRGAAFPSAALSLFPPLGIKFKCIQPADCEPHILIKSLPGENPRKAGRRESGLHVHANRQKVSGTCRSIYCLLFKIYAHSYTDRQTNI